MNMQQRTSNMLPVSARARRRGGHGASCAGVACEHTLGRQPLHLYGYLWAKPEFVADDKSGTFSFVVPDTVLFKQQKPVKWFFTSRQEKGKILVKSKKNLSVTHVLSAFLEPKHFTTNINNAPAANTTAAALSAAAENDESLVVATFAYVDRSSSGEIVLVVEHVTRAALHHLLTTREKPTLSVLQRFIPTRSGYNHLIQTVFTPDNCLIRKCVSSHLVSDTRLCVAERTATFEADERHVQPREVTNRELCDQIEHMHLEMSTHLQKIICKPVARHVAYFKVGADDRIYLLWSSMLSFETGQLAFAKNLRLSLSHQDRLQHLVATTAPGRVAADKELSSSVASSHALTKTCPRCQTNMARRLVDFYATYKAVIKSYEAEPQDPLAHDISCIPPLLDKILSPISEGRFKELSQQSAFLYRTIALCQACAKQINTTANTKKPRGSSAATAAAPSTAKPKLAQVKPIYMQSAHSIFWGRTERLADAERKPKQSMQKMSVVVRPSSAGASIHSRPSATSIGSESRTHKQSSEGLTRATFKRILPLLASQAAAHSAQVNEPKHCVQKLAEYLQKTYGGASVRLALARASIYPPTSLVSLDMLQWVCEPKLLADVFTYWTEFCKINESEYSSSAMDIDALDAMLSVYISSNDLALKSRAKVALAQPGEAITVSSRLRPSIVSSTLAVFTHHPTPLVHPVRPTTARPSSGGVSRGPSVRSSRTIVHAAVLSRSLHTESPATQSPRPPARSNQIERPDNSKAGFSSAQTRLIDGIECEVDVSATQRERGGGMFELTIRVRRTHPQPQFEDNALPSVMSLTLDTEQLLDIVVRSGTASTHSLPPTGDALVRVVLDALSLQHGYLSVHSPLSIPSPATPSPASPPSDAFTVEELRLLHETLLHAQPSHSPTD